VRQKNNRVLKQLGAAQAHACTLYFQGVLYIVVFVAAVSAHGREHDLTRTQPNYLLLTFFLLYLSFSSCFPCSLISKTPYAPSLKGTGKTTTVSSWDEFDERLGKFFDGTAFTPAHGYDTMVFPGGGAAVSDFYLPFMEDYPSNLSVVYEPHELWSLFASNLSEFTHSFRMMATSDGDTDKAAVRNVCSRVNLLVSLHVFTISVLCNMLTFFA